MSSQTRRHMLLSPLAAMAPPFDGRRRGILFTGRGRTGFLNPDRRLELVNDNGTGARTLPLRGITETDSGWGAYGFFRDGRVLLQSLKLPDDWQGRPFDDYYPRSRTRIWAGHTGSGALEELCYRERLSSFYSPCLLLDGDTRIAVTALVSGKSVLYTMNLDGTGAQPVTAAGEFVYGVSLSPDGQTFAFHSNYRIHTARRDGSGRRELAAEKGMLYFGTSWSPDGEWILFQACDPKADPAHDWSAIAIVRASGREPVRFLTSPASAWFGASFGAEDNPGGGSNMPQWAPDGSGVLYVRRIPESRTPWVYQAGRKDTDHFNRDFLPAQARGGTHLAIIDPATNRERHLTPPEEGCWDFRATWSPDARRICFLRARVGSAPELWAMDATETKPRKIGAGLRGAGAEHPVWVP